LALGCARGDDVSPLAPAVGEFIALEPAEQWWREAIGGTASRYLKPAVMGGIALEDSSVDLATSLNALHHVPNVSHVVAEIARVLCPGGLFLLNEPISSMGDWRKPRIGGTANERGLPIDWLQQLLERVGFRTIRRRFIMCRPLSLIAAALGFRNVYNNPLFVRLDALGSAALKWNTHYHRDTRWKKAAPGSVFLMLEKM
jgi:SAM-dependent methyltransferase